MELRLLQREEIDDEKWDNYIANSSQSNVYGLTWYLDAVTQGRWQALVSGDYDIVLPFLKKSKYFLPYITQPFLCQRLGLFCKEKEIPADVIDAFYDKLSAKVVKYDVLTTGNFSLKLKHGIKENHIIDLTLSYENLANKYNRNTNRNLAFAKKVESQKVTYHAHTTTQIDFLMDNDPTLLINKNHTKVESLIKSAISLKSGFLISVMENNEIRSAAFFLTFGNRIYFLLCASDPRGKEIKSMYLLIDHVIKRYAEEYKIFDFTGSNIKNIAQRNLGFGASVERYYHIFGSWL
jgi:hypothetical protein